MSCKPAEDEDWKCTYWAVPWLRCLVACNAARMSGFIPRLIHCDLCWTKRSWNRFFSKEFGCPLQENFSPICPYTFTHLPSTECNLSNWQDRYKTRYFFLFLSFYSSEVSPHQYRKEHLIWRTNHFNALQNCEKRLSPSSVSPHGTTRLPLDGFS
jgi:hypothetical protein